MGVIFISTQQFGCIQFFVSQANLDFEIKTEWHSLKCTKENVRMKLNYVADDLSKEFTFKFDVKVDICFGYDQDVSLIHKIETE